MAKVEYGLQMYSLRDVTKDDLKGALKMAADMGYKVVEFAGFFGHSAEEVKSWLDEYGLVCESTHTGISGVTPDTIDDVIKYHKTIGCKNIIFPAANYGTEAEINVTIEKIQWVDKILRDNGMTLGYHNHSYEFLPNKDGKMFEEELLARTNINVEIDTFWLFNAGLNVIEYLEAHKDRIKVIHLKDGIPSVDKSWEHIYEGVVGKSVGSGKAPVNAVREWCIKNNVRMVIESEGLDPTGPEEVSRCIEYLRTLD